MRRTNIVLLWLAAALLCIGFLSLQRASATTGVLLTEGTGTTLLSANDVPEPARPARMTLSARPQSDGHYTFMRETALPALRKKLFLLALQGAPVPDALPQLLTLGETVEEEEALARFEERAAQLFGEEWREEFRQERVPQSPGMPLQEYLSSLTAHADIVAEWSPLAAEDIRARAQSLLPNMQTTALEKVHQEIFPEERTPSLTSFREEGEKLFTEIPDLLALLRDPEHSRTVSFLQEETAHLAAALPSLADVRDLTLFMKRFDALTASILTLTPLPPLPLLQEDFGTLLTNLSSYLTQAGVRKEQQDALQALEEELANIHTEEALDEFLTHLEDFLNTLPATPSPP